MSIYADYNGSAPLCTEVIEFLKERLDNGPYANPNANHYIGQKTMMAMNKSRSTCAKILGASPKQLIFNSGSTEGITHAFHSVLFNTSSKSKNLIIISGIEHSAVINCAEFYEKNEGFKVKVVPTKSSGQVDKEVLFRWINEEKNNIALISIMAANNETGVIQPYKEISKICKEAQIPYICDTTQLIGKTDFNFEEAGMDYAFLSGHKIGAMTGAGILLAKDPGQMNTLILGGGQESGLRGGTQNYIGNETLAVGLSVFQKEMAKLSELKKRREDFESNLKKKWPDLVIMGEESPRLAGSTFLSLPGISAQAVQMELEAQNIFTTTSSACCDTQSVPSKVLKSMGIPDNIARGAVRVSLGLCSPFESYNTIEKALNQAYQKLSEAKKLS